jgi:hypothetical protein
MPEMITTCKVCGCEWTPDHNDYITGMWRICTDCRSDTADDDPHAQKAQKGAMP